MIERYGEAWEAPVRELLRTCLGAQAMQLDKAHMRWQYELNPAAGEESPLLVFGDADEALGVLGMIPVRLHAGVAEVDAAWGIDVQVLPEFHNAGIGGLLVEGWDAATPVSLSLGVTDMAFEVFLASGRTHVGNVPVFKRLLAPAKLLERRLGSALLAKAAGKALSLRGAGALRAAARTEGLEWSRLEEVGAECDELWQRAATGLGFAVRRDAAYLRWRFEQLPGGAYRIFAVHRGGRLEAWVALASGAREGLRTGYVADVLWADAGDALAFALARATEELAADGAEVVECLASEAVLAAALERLGFLRRPTKTRLLCKVNQPELESAFAGAGELGRWHVTYADSDALTVILHEGA